MIIFSDTVDVQLYVNDKERGKVNWTFNFIVSVSSLYIMGSSQPVMITL